MFPLIVFDCLWPRATGQLWQLVVHTPRKCRLHVVRHKVRGLAAVKVEEHIHIVVDSPTLVLGNIFYPGPHGYVFQLEYAVLTRLQSCSRCNFSHQVLHEGELYSRQHLLTCSRCCIAETPCTALIFALQMLHCSSSYLLWPDKPAGRHSCHWQTFFPYRELCLLISSKDP